MTAHVFISSAQGGSEASRCWGPASLPNLRAPGSVTAVPKMSGGEWQSKPLKINLWPLHVHTGDHRHRCAYSCIYIHMHMLHFNYYIHRKLGNTDAHLIYFKLAKLRTFPHGHWDACVACGDVDGSHAPTWTPRCILQLWWCCRQQCLKWVSVGYLDSATELPCLMLQGNYCSNGFDTLQLS